MARILCLNSGSSSLKFAVWETGDGETCLFDDELRQLNDIGLAVAEIFDGLEARDLLPVAGVGHRVVFGGARLVEPALVDEALLGELRALSHFAPLHMPASLAAIDAALRRAPDVPHVACFDTAFHRRMPALAQRVPLPRSFWDAGIRRFGYHGLSYEYVVSNLADAQLGRGVLAHLGHGASLAAVRDGVPVDTTMGLSPDGGLMMSTRSGDLDPGVMVYLAREKGLDAEMFERLVTRESGLLGVSGTSGDMQRLLERRGSDSRAHEAIELFCYIAAKQIGAMVSTIGGLDTLVFTGGIGERAAAVRWEICERIGHLGVRLDAMLNSSHAPTISVPGASCTVRIVQTNENLMIARHTGAAIQRRTS
jgi:acetate kinase